MKGGVQSSLQHLHVLQRQALMIAGVAGIGCVIGAILATEAFIWALLFAFVCGLALPLGSQMILMVHYLTGGRWGRALRPTLNAAAATVPLFAVLFLFIAFSLPYLYIWAQPEAVAHDHLLLEKSSYLNIPRFLICAGIYFAVWIGVHLRVAALESQFEQTKDPQVGRRLRTSSAIGLLLVGLTVTFAAIDWMMSLEPHWYSSIYGMLVTSGMVLPAFAFAILATMALPTLQHNIDADVWNDLGNLLLALVMTWAYMAFSQFFLIWSGNLPEEIPWYLRRSHGVWFWIALAVIALNFVLPFFLLLSRENKRNTKRLALVASLILVGHILNQYWLVMPAYLELHEPEPLEYMTGMHWLDPVVLLAVVALWLGLFTIMLARRLPKNISGDDLEGATNDDFE